MQRKQLIWSVVNKCAVFLYTPPLIEKEDVEKYLCWSSYNEHQENKSCQALSWVVEVFLDVLACAWDEGVEVLLARVNRLAWAVTVANLLLQTYQKTFLQRRY